MTLGGSLALLGACANGNVSGSPQGDAGATSGGATSAGGHAGGTVNTGGNASGGTAGSASAGSAGAGSGPSASPYLPARIRRLTNAEYDASVQALFGTTSSPSVTFSFPPDARQGPTNAPAGQAFTVNDAQRVDPVLADKLDTAALALVSEARANGKLAALAPCTDPSGANGEACAKAFVQSFGARAYRRALTDEEVAGLVAGPASVYHVGADGYTYADGIDSLARVLLQTPGFLYVTELGVAGAGGTFSLTPSETAASLAYLMTAAPPDDALLAKAATGALATPEGREAEARRLLDTAAGRARLVRVVREWLGITNVAHREKAQSVYPEFAGVSASMERESQAFINEVLANSTGTLAELLTADWTIADAPLASIYGVTSAGEGKRTSLASTKRRGILNQGAFLSVFGSNNNSHPVFRGVAIMRRIACLNTPDPGALGIMVAAPPDDPSRTTRERFAAHAMNAECQGCHKTIDPLGFALENFDGMGKLRTTENNLPVDTKVTVSLGSDFDGTYADSAALASALAQSASVKTCLARQLFRSSAARSDGTIAGAEDAFVELWKQLPAAQQGRLVDVLLAFVKSPLFVQRRTP